MILLTTAEQMRQADRQTIEEVGLPGAVLMENAAQGAARVILDALGSVEGIDFAALCGRGNNGGDGLAILRILAGQGAMTTAYVFCKQEQYAGDAALNLAVARQCGVRIKEVPDDEAFTKLEAEMAGHEFYVDALLGTGLNSPVRGRYASAIGLLNGLGRPVLAVDIPSGLCADTGRPLGEAVRADFTATFGLVKLGLALEPGEYTGQLSLVDISIPPAVVAGLDLNAAMLEPEDVAAILNQRLLDGHKGTFGHLMVIGGSPGFSGAVCLAGMGGLRAGAGLVTVGLPAGLNPVIEAKLTSVMSQPLPETTEGGLALAALPVLLDLCQGKRAVVLGPGLGQMSEGRELARELAAQLTAPLVVDADGLNALAGNLEEIKWGPEEVVLTPHPGEAARLLDCAASDILADRPAAARRLAIASGAVCVLKGARSLVASPQGDIWVNPTGNALLASGGSGDVLSGLIGGLMAQGLDAMEAACAGVFVHGLAADLAQGDFGLRGLASEELPDYLPQAFAMLEAPDLLEESPDDDGPLSSI